MHTLKNGHAAMTDPRTIEQHGSPIIAALEHAWAAIQDTHPDVPDVVIVTGAGSNQKGTPEGYQLRGHHESSFLKIWASSVRRKENQPASRKN